MRAFLCVLLAAPLGACGNDPVTTMTATDSGSGSTSTSDPTGGGPGPGTSTEDTPTGGSVGMTESGTTTASTSTGESTTVSTSTSAGETTGTSGDPGTGTTMPVIETTGTADTGTTVSDETSGSESGSSEVGEESSTGEAACACPDLEVPLDDGIFVLSINAELYKYFPEFNTFDVLGPLNCGLFGQTFSMAVDRLGNAWVQYQSGELRTVPVSNVMVCNNPGYVVGQNGIINFGMAFVSNSAVDPCDRIYGNRASGIPEGNMVSDFFSIDPMNQQVVPIGKSNYGTAEVTGTGDGRAFLFAGMNPAKLVEIDKTNGAVITVTPLPGVELGNAWAFAHFAGDFYFFTNSKGGPGSEVTHIDYDDSDMNGQQQVTEVVANAPISIVGAGVSTCAPFAPQ